MNKRVVSISVGLSVILLGACSVSAFTSIDGTTYDSNTVPLTGDVDPNQTSTCLDLKSDALRYRSTDGTTNGEVSSLQDFLVATSFLKAQITGYFGLGTLSAVKQYQRSAGLNSTGYVGPLTKAKIKEQSCAGITQIPSGGGSVGGSTTKGIPLPTPSSRINPYPPLMPPYSTSSRPAICTMEARLCPNGKMMGRNPMTCEWISSSCGATSTDINPLRYPYDPLPPVRVSTGTLILPQSSVGIASTGTLIITQPPKDAIRCTDMVRFCPDGMSIMPRDSSCGWHPELCTGGSVPVGGSQIPETRIISPINTGTMNRAPLIEE